MKDTISLQIDGKTYKVSPDEWKKSKEFYEGLMKPKQHVVQICAEDFALSGEELDYYAKALGIEIV